MPPAAAPAASASPRSAPSPPRSPPFTGTTTTTGPAPAAAANEALHTAYSWLQAGTYTDRTGTRLRTATGNLSIAAGWLSYDSGRPADAHSLYGEALAAARIAADRALEAHAFGCLSLLAKAQGRPREAVANAQGAQAVARHLGSPRLLALFHAREAGGWALMGDRQATDAAIVRAHHHYAAGPAERIRGGWSSSRPPNSPASKPSPAPTWASTNAPPPRRAGRTPPRQRLRPKPGLVHRRHRDPTCKWTPARARSSRRSRPRHRVPARCPIRPPAPVPPRGRRSTPAPRTRPGRRGLDRAVPHHHRTPGRTGVTTPTDDEVAIRTYGPGDIPALLDTLADIWADAHPELVDTPGGSTDGLSTTALRRQITGHARREGFVLVAAYAHGSPVGFAYAFPATPEYWYGPELLPDIPEHIRAAASWACANSP
ncbi:hypothetical protein ACFQ60_47715 [Streptomyces zhihengii]